MGICAGFHGIARLRACQLGLNRRLGVRGVCSEPKTSPPHAVVAQPVGMSSINFAPSARRRLGAACSAALLYLIADASPAWAAGGGGRHGSGGLSALVVLALIMVLLGLFAAFRAGRERRRSELAAAPTDAHPSA